MRFEVMDAHHATEKPQSGIKSLREQRRDELTFPSLRTKLRDGLRIKVAYALASKIDLSSNPAGLDREEVLSVMRYIRQHGEAGYLDYPKHSLMGLPFGRVSIESAIRRVINLRLKRKGTFWRAAQSGKCHCIESFNPEREGG